jgi:uncharacterized protein (DUF1697 family)
LAVAFLAGTPASPSLEPINKAKDPAEELVLSGAEAYLYYPNGQGRSKMTNALLEKHLSVASTVRNWRTVNTLLAMVKQKESRWQ